MIFVLIVQSTVLHSNYIELYSLKYDITNITKNLQICAHRNKLSKILAHMSRNTLEQCLKKKKKNSLHIKQKTEGMKPVLGK